MWSYTLPAQRSVEILSEAGYPLYTSIPNCARTLRAMADYRALRERFLRPIEVRTRHAGGPGKAARQRWPLAGPVLCEWEARPVLAALRHRRRSASARSRSPREAAVEAAQVDRRPVALKVQSPDILHKTEAGAVALNLRSADDVRAAYDRVLARRAPARATAHILGVLVQPMAPPGREVILGVKRDPTFGPLLMVGLGGVHVEMLKDVALAPVPLGEREARELLARLEGRAAARRPSRQARRPISTRWSS